MLRTDLIKLINEGKMWAFVGSGASIDSGCPSWRRLVEGTVARLDEDTRRIIANDERYKQAFSKGLFARCFSRIEALSSREAMERAVAAQLDPVRTAGRLMGRLADWPFAGYMTTNYDGLLASALREVGEHGWAPVGNSADEVRKVAGDATNVIWHVHGGITLPADRSRMILTEKDYEDLYLDGSPVVTQLRGLLAQRRVVFIGFGFEDPELMRLLRVVGRLCNPARPAFAFLSGVSGSEHESGRVELLEKYNIDVIPYRVLNGSHEQLIQMLDTYGALILGRSLKFGQPERPCPSYDPETTGLLIYNQLSLRGGARVGEDVLGSLLRARLLSLLKYRGPTTVAGLLADLAERVRLIRGDKVPSLLDQASVDAIGRSLQDLSAQGLIKLSGGTDGTSLVALTDEGSDQIADHAAAAGRLSDQFSASLRDRARNITTENPEAMNRVAYAAESFLKDCVQRRALGVAMVWNSPRLDFQRYHMVGLLQALPEFMVQLASGEEGLALSELVQDVLARPSKAEAQYVGVALQAQFGVNLLGYDPETIRTRARELSRTLFLVDSSTLIPLLARSSVGYHSAHLLVDRLKAVGSTVATSALLATEVAEHARWAIEHVGFGKPLLTAKTLAAATGRAGSRSNAFLEGLLEEMNRGHVAPDLGAYLDSVCAHPAGHTGTDDAFITAIRSAGVACLSFHDWEGFEHELWAERDNLQEEIAERRKAAHPPTYRHERQVKAEAEALIIIRNARRGVFKFNGQNVADAYFISHTRAIDDVAGPGLPITMRPVAVLQWLSTVTACAPEELGLLVNGLLWELAERGLAILDQERLLVSFSPLSVASRARLQEEIAAYRIHIAQLWGEDAHKSFAEISELDLPVAMDSYYAQKAEYLEKRLTEERKAKEAAQAQAKLTEKERRELTILQAKDKHRGLKARSARRAAASRSGRKRRKK